MIDVRNCDVAELYSLWSPPMVIHSDGPYGVGGFDGDPKSPKCLGEWYEPHIKEWSKKATPQTTLWFWNTEVGWATVHPVLVENGWLYMGCNIWDKGKSHVAGNVNTKTIRHFPTVTEVCVQYVRKPRFYFGGEEVKSTQQWLRDEWRRTGLPFSKTNEACGVKSAATRKYFSGDHLWYFPPKEMFARIVEYANRFGNPDGRPYFSLDGKMPLTANEWECMRSKFHCPFGVTNVWSVPQLRSKERIKDGNKVAHLNQKPMELVRRLILASSDEGDVVWDPFGGLFTTALVSHGLNRDCFSAEVNPVVYKVGLDRLLKALHDLDFFFDEV